MEKNKIISYFSCPPGVEIEEMSPEGYPDPSCESHGCFVWPSLSSKYQPSTQASRVTLAATLAAPTILNLESALVVTVKLMPGNREERYLSYVVVVPSASTYTYWLYFIILIDPEKEKIVKTCL